ncbi:MAG: ATP-binding cassette domain-containing protein [Gemmatimonadaceae bacterium]
MIECRDVSVHVGNFAIRGISFVVPQGVHAALTGPTASGKTTLLELIAGAIIPTSGSIRVSGIDVTGSPPETRGIGFVPQHGYLFPHMNASENVRYGARDRETVSSLTRQFGIEHLMARTVTKLSGGERQVVALCRALAPRPGVLLLDEPFSALDADRRSKVLDEFAALQTEWGFTVLHVTHDETDARAATLRLEMADGAIARPR